MRTINKFQKDATFFPLSLKERIDLKNICEFAERLDARQAIPATSSNFSIRASTESFLISRSGIHKRHLNPSSFLRVNLRGKPMSIIAPKPSDETLLHALIYRNIPDANVVIHCHAPELELLRAPHHSIAGHELLKALEKKTHEEDYNLPVFSNSQDMEKLSLDIEKKLFTKKQSVHAFILESHGIYCLGKNIDETIMRLEALLHLIGISIRVSPKK